jgi:hypothetical protein
MRYGIIFYFTYLHPCPLQWAFPDDIFRAVNPLTPFFRATIPSEK